MKTQFGNHPHIYNQFLEIMKNFKAQAYVPWGTVACCGRCGFDWVPLHPRSLRKTKV